MNESTINHCFGACPPIKSKSEYKTDEDSKRDRCCMMKCYYTSTKILVEESLDVDNLKESYARSENDQLSKDWTEIVVKSVDKCVEKCEQ
jgi:hypothetical protein